MEKRDPAERTIMDGSGAVTPARPTLRGPAVSGSEDRTVMAGEIGAAKPAPQPSPHAAEPAVQVAAASQQAAPSDATVLGQKRKATPAVNTPLPPEPATPSGPGAGPSALTAQPFQPTVLPDPGTRITFTSPAVSTRLPRESVRGGGR